MILMHAIDVPVTWLCVFLPRCDSTTARSVGVLGCSDLLTEPFPAPWKHPGHAARAARPCLYPANSVDDSPLEFRKARGLSGMFDSGTYFPHVYNVTHIVRTINAQYRKGTSKLNAMRWSGPERLLLALRQTATRAHRRHAPDPNMRRWGGAVASFLRSEDPAMFVLAQSTVPKQFGLSQANADAIQVAAPAPEGSCSRVSGAGAVDTRGV